MEAATIERTSEIATDTRRKSKTMTKVSGMISRTAFGVTRNIVTQMPVETLLNSLSMRAIPDDLAELYKDVQRVTTVSRCDAFEDYYSRHLLQQVDVAGCIPTITVALSKRPIIQQFSDRLDIVEFEPQTAFASDGLGRLNTFMRTMGRYHQHIRGTSKPNSSRIQRRRMMSTLIANLEVSVKIIFGDQRDLDRADIGQIFSDINFTQTKVMPRHAMRLNSTDPVIKWAREMAKIPAVANNGGMNEDKATVTKNAKYVMTLGMMTRFCRGVIGGDYLQIKSTVSLVLKDGSEVTKEHLARSAKFGTFFFEKWTETLGERFHKDKTGFQLSSTLIQALGLVIYTITLRNYIKPDQEILDELELVAEELGSLDYSRQADHWSQCKAMKKTDKGYANGTSGGKTFRIGIAEYFSVMVGYNLAL